MHTGPIYTLLKPMINHNIQILRYVITSKSSNNGPKTDFDENMSLKSKSRAIVDIWKCTRRKLFCMQWLNAIKVIVLLISIFIKSYDNDGLFILFDMT